MALRLLATVLLMGLAAQMQRASSQPTAAPTTSSNSNIPPLPPIQHLPNGCGAVAQVIDGFGCTDCAAWAGLTLEQFVALNPLIGPQCNTIGLQPGSAVCVGDTIAFCSNVHVATASDTCKSIRKTEGPIVNIGGAKGTTCAELASSSGVPVCINPDVAKCQRNTICGLAISADLQELLAVQPDYCNILSECQASPKLTTFENKPTLALTIRQPTSAVRDATATGAHPELTSLAEVQLKNPAVALRVTLTPKWFADGSQAGMTRYEFGEIVSGNRKLLTTWVPIIVRPTGFTAVPRLRYY